MRMIFLICSEGLDASSSCLVLVSVAEYAL